MRNDGNFILKTRVHSNFTPVVPLSTVASLPLQSGLVYAGLFIICHAERSEASYDKILRDAQNDKRRGYPPFVIFSSSGPCCRA